MLNDIPFRLSRRRLVSLLLKCGGFVLSIPLLSHGHRKSVDDEFVIVDGWVLRADEIG